MAFARGAPKWYPQGMHLNGVPRGGAKTVSPGRDAKMAFPVGAPKCVPRQWGVKVASPEWGAKIASPEWGVRKWCGWCDNCHTSLKYGVAGILYGLATPVLSLRKWVKKKFVAFDTLDTFCAPQNMSSC